MEARQRSFTIEYIKASFKGAGLWRADMQRACKKLKGTGKRKARPDDRPTLTDIPSATGEGELERSLGGKIMRGL